jgi:Tfp pilus assembly protein PilO
MSLLRRVFVERRRVVLPLVVFLVANLAVLGLIVWPLERSVAGAAAAREQAILSLAAARKLEKDANDQRAGKARADVELRKFYTEILPKDFAAARNLTNFWLAHKAEQSRLTFRAGQYDPEPVRGSNLVRFKGEVTLVGEYADIRRFLYEVETAQEFVIIEKVALSQPNATQGGAQLELALSVVTYFVPAGLPGVASR